MPLCCGLPLQEGSCTSSPTARVQRKLMSHSAHFPTPTPPLCLPAGRRPACEAAPAPPCPPRRTRAGSRPAQTPGRGRSSRSSPPARDSHSTGLGNTGSRSLVEPGWAECGRSLPRPDGQPTCQQVTGEQGPMPPIVTKLPFQDSQHLSPAVRTLPLRSLGCGRSITLASAAAAA